MMPGEAGKYEQSPLLGLLGYPLSHSRSPEIFRAFFEKEQRPWKYELIQMEDVSALDAFILEHPSLLGFNVTIPHKQALYKRCDILGPEAKFSGAVNTVLVHRPSGKIQLEGRNTDIFGFEKLLGSVVFEENTSALILGNGGSGRAVQYVLKEKGIPFTVVSRSFNPGTIGYRQVDGNVLDRNRLIIQTTPLGMHPDSDSAPEIPYDLLGPAHTCIDLVYNPAVTLFLQKAAERHAQTTNGSLMLQAQAERSWQFFKNHAQEIL